jgi:hypothetical protein
VIETDLDRHIFPLTCPRAGAAARSRLPSRLMRAARGVRARVAGGGRAARPSRR